MCLGFDGFRPIYQLTHTFTNCFVFLYLERGFHCALNPSTGRLALLITNGYCLAAALHFSASFVCWRNDFGERANQVQPDAHPRADALHSLLPLPRPCVRWSCYPAELTSSLKISG